MQTGMLRLVDPEAMLINFERADLRFERRSRDTESRRRTRRARYAAFARGERRLDSRSLVGCQFVIQRRSNIRLDDALSHGDRHALEGAVASCWWCARESARLRDVDPIAEAAAICRYVARVA